MNKYDFTVGGECDKYRLDKFLIYNFPEKSRNYLQKLIKENLVTVNSRFSLKSGYQLKQGDQVHVVIPEPKKLNLAGKKMFLKVVYEDKNLIIINKDAGIKVHPATRHDSETSLVQGILNHCGKDLSGISGMMRPGIVHRLDKDTSGLLMIAKNDQTHQYLSDLIKERIVKKEYLVLVKGRVIPRMGRIEAPIGRSARDRKKMAVTLSGKKMAISEYTVQKYFSETTLLKVRIITGRTHQIRVHMQSIGYPVVLDSLYGEKKFNEWFKDKYELKRQFVHAYKLTFVLQKQKKARTFVAEMPNDLKQTLKKLLTSLSQL